MDESTEKDREKIDDDQKSKPRDTGNVQSELEPTDKEDANSWLLVIGHGV